MEIIQSTLWYSIYVLMLPCEAQPQTEEEVLHG